MEALVRGGFGYRQVQASSQPGGVVYKGCFIQGAGFATYRDICKWAGFGEPVETPKPPNSAHTLIITAANAVLRGEALFAKVGNLRPVCDIRIAKTRKIIVPAGCKITKILVRRLLTYRVGDLAFTQPKHEPVGQPNSYFQAVITAGKIKTALRSIQE